MKKANKKGMTLVEVVISNLNGCPGRNCSNVRFDSYRS